MWEGLHRIPNADRVRLLMCRAKSVRLLGHRQDGCRGRGNGTLRVPSGAERLLAELTGYFLSEASAIRRCRPDIKVAARAGTLIDAQAQGDANLFRKRVGLLVDLVGRIWTGRLAVPLLAGWYVRNFRCSRRILLCALYVGCQIFGFAQ